MLGDIIKNMRIKNDLTQDDLAKKLLISKSTIGMYEQNRRLPDINTIVKLSEIFNISTDELLGLATLEKDNSFISEKTRGFGQILQNLRKARNLKQSDLAAILHISPSAYGFYEQGRREPSLDTLIKLSKYFHVTLDYLSGLSSDSILNDSAKALSNTQLLNDEEQEVLEYYNKLDKTDRRWIVGQMIDLDRKAHDKEKDTLDSRQA